ncbi:TerD family protein [Streptomyces sp. NPDC001848]|uniref:TerD family protein n=1 Tax=Streptomyces sp. NPDC001848 TaxID=3364618 RepID=UPI0036C9D295
MGVALTKGGNVSLSKQAQGLTAVTVGLGWRANTGYELDAGALLCDRSGKVLSDEHFVFFNNLSTPDGSVRHSGSGGPLGVDDQQIHVDLMGVPNEVTKIVFLVSLYDAPVRGQTFAHLGGAHIRVVDEDGGAELARYDLATAGLTAETALVLGELYRHGAEWKFRAVGQGYASGLAGIATDYGVSVLEESASPAPPVTVAEFDPNAGPSFASAPTTTPRSQPQTVTPSPQPSGSSPMTCFFDPTHGPGITTVTWSPQWGVPRQIQACGGCAQRVQTTVPPFYTPPQQGYPQPVQQGYPQPVQQGYPQPVQQGYPQQGQPGPYTDHQQHGGGRRFGTGALIGAGAAGLIGGALLNEAFDDDEPDVVVNNYYEE